MLALGLLGAVAVVLWLVQSVRLRAAGLPVRVRLHASGLSRSDRRLLRGLTYALLGLLVVAYPLLCGQSPLLYYAGLFPIDPRRAGLLAGFATVTVYLGLLYVAWAATDNVRFGLRDPAAAVARHVAALPFSAVLGAGVEELVFRGVVQAGLMESVPAVPAVAAGAVAFAAAHYVRRVKRTWTFAGHVALGIMLCTAFACTRALWLPVGLHTGGIFVIMGVRPFVRYRGPAWLVGASIYPYAGALGIVGLTALTANVWYAYGGVR